MRCGSGPSPSSTSGSGRRWQWSCSLACSRSCSSISAECRGRGWDDDYRGTDHGSTSRVHGASARQPDLRLSSVDPDLAPVDPRDHLDCPHVQPVRELVPDPGRPAQRAGSGMPSRTRAFPTLDNYQEVLFPDVGAGLGNALLNSAAIAIVATIIPIAIAAFAAYAFAWIDFRGREWLFIGTVALLAVPTQVSLIPLLSAYSNGVALTLPIVDRRSRSSRTWAVRRDTCRVADAHGLRAAVRDLPAAQLHRRPAQGSLRVGVDRWRGSLQGLLAAGAAAVGAGVWPPLRSSSSCGPGTTTSSPSR